MPKLTHFDVHGQAIMVDVGDKDVTDREAVARASVLMNPETLKIILDGKAKKGDVLGVARLGRNHGGEKDSRYYTAGPPYSSKFGKHRILSRRGKFGDRYRGASEGRGKDRRRNGSPDCRDLRRPHNLRHVQGSGQKHGHFRRNAYGEKRRTFRPLQEELRPFTPPAGDHTQRISYFLQKK